jgi:glutamyl/glutaminyl-tRNA synthetase
MREQAIRAGKKPQYNRKCRDRKDSQQGKPFVIRAKIPLEGHVDFVD